MVSGSTVYGEGSLAKERVQRLGVCGGGDMTGRAVSGWGIMDTVASKRVNI